MRLLGAWLLLACSYSDCTPRCAPDDDDDDMPSPQHTRAILGEVCYEAMDHAAPHFTIAEEVSPIDDPLVVDFDRDDIPDVIGLDERWSLFRGVGDGTFAAPIAISDETDPFRDAAAADVDGDGSPDVIAEDRSGSVQART